MGSQAQQYTFGTNRTRTICEVFRDINDEVQGDSEEELLARDLVVNGMLLSKKMVSILNMFKNGIMADWFDDNSEENIRKAHVARSNNPNYKVGTMFS